MRRNPSTLANVLIAKTHACPTVCAQVADTMQSGLSSLKAPHKPNIGIDLMGSDTAPDELLEALVKQAPSTVALTFIGNARLAAKSPFPFHIAEESVEMEDAPLTALRKKKKASLFEGLRLLKEGKIDALISAGNTGALVSGAKVILGTLPTIDRPALLARLPTQKKPVAVLDVGANIHVKAPQLIQFAKLGVAYQEIRGVTQPTVGLLNIGSEAHKGTPEQRLAYRSLKTKSFHFNGNVEGRDAFDGKTDVLVTDGFTGNIFLKTVEGVVRLLAPKEIHLSDYGGALLIGVQGLVFKCHGNAEISSFLHTLEEASFLLAHNFLRRLEEKI